MVKMNRGEPQVKFLSNVVTGGVKVDNPDGVIDGTDNLGMVYGRYDDPAYHAYGAASGKNKQVTVDEGPASVRMKGGPR